MLSTKCQAPGPGLTWQAATCSNLGNYRFLCLLGWRHMNEDMTWYMHWSLEARDLQQLRNPAWRLANQYACSSQVPCPAIARV